jgi:sec-independent protein translocase protein TatB
MFDIGWGELVLIGIVALIAIGPKELPTVMRSLGQWMGRIRRMASEFQGQFQEALREAEMDDLKKHADEINSAITDATNIDPLAESETKSESETESGAEAAEPSPVETVTTGAATEGDGADRVAEPEPESEPEPEPADEQAPAAATAHATEASAEHASASEPEKTPEIAVPLPEPPAAVTEKDFTPVEPPPERAEGKA